MIMILGPDANVDDTIHTTDTNSVADTELGRIMVLKGYSIVEQGKDFTFSIAPPPIRREYQTESGEVAYCF